MKFSIFKIFQFSVLGVAYARIFVLFAFELSICAAGTVLESLVLSSFLFSFQQQQPNIFFQSCILKFQDFSLSAVGTGAPDYGLPFHPLLPDYCPEREANAKAKQKTKQKQSKSKQ